MVQTKIGATMHVSFTYEQLAALRAMAKETGAPIAELVRRAVEKQYVKKEEGK